MALKKIIRRLRISWRKNWRKRPFFTIFCLITVPFIVGVSAVSGACRLVVYINSSGRIYDQAELVPETSVAMVLGTSWMQRRYGMFGAIEPSKVFYNRIDAAAELYQKGRVKHIICSGAARAEDGYDEGTTMRLELLRRGIPPKAVSVDNYGWRTLDSVIRLKTIWGVKKVVVVSQGYHVSRAIFQADHYGVNAVGYCAKPGPFLQRLRGNYNRESLALIKLMIDIYITDKGPINPNKPVDPGELQRVRDIVSQSGKHWSKCNCF